MPKPEGPLLRVVARLRDGAIVKGWVDESLKHGPEGAPSDHGADLPEEFVLHKDSPPSAVSIKRDTLKALFFVKSFEGDKQYKEVKFFEKNPAIKGLWVRVKFYDDESLEGIISNSVDFVIKPSFLLKPPDPRSNNDVLHVVKGSLIGFRVLGVRMDY